MKETNQNLAIFCDFENIALGVRDANFAGHFDIGLALARLLDKGRVLVKKSYADWHRYKNYRRKLHEAGFELLEVPHASYSGKNSADIYMVCDALDLCYTRHHIDTFVILSGDSDFSPLVRRLRENNKHVIGMGVKNSTSDLLVEGCDDFIYYDDLVRRQSKRKPRKSKPRTQKSSSSSSGSGSSNAKSSGSKNESAPEAPKTEQKLGDKEECFELILDTLESLFQDYEDSVWGSQVKQTLKRKKPNFDESYYGWRTFSQVLIEMQEKKLVEMQRDEKSGGWKIFGFGADA